MKKKPTHLLEPMVRRDNRPRQNGPGMEQPPVPAEVEALEAALRTLGRLRARYDSEFSPPMESDSKVAEGAVWRLLREERRRASTGGNAAGELQPTPNNQK